LHETYVRTAEHYVTLAEEANGPIPRPVGPDHVWGAALAAIDAVGPDARIVNLETALTTSDAAWPGKEVLYRTHPANVEVLQAARIDCCSLANNHVLDWGQAGLLETLDRLHEAGISTAGAGRDRAEAETPAVIDSAGGRVIVVALGSVTAGVPLEWAAGDGRPGVDLVASGGPKRTAEGIAARIAQVEQRGDIVVASIHWGSNWGYEVPRGQRSLAHELIDAAGVDVVHGHSSHHPRGIELYRGRLILHGCGDFITDYEGIPGYEGFRGDLMLAYFATVDAPTGRLQRLAMAPFRMRRFRLERAPVADAGWLRETLDRHSRPLGTRVELDADGMLTAHPA
jgi:poly-gamma-glutamate synthesis protein (capsule biosynthesis protein)